MNRIVPLVVVCSALLLTGCAGPPTGARTQSPLRDTAAECASTLTPIGNSVLALEGRVPQPVPVAELSRFASDLLDAGALACSWSPAARVGEPFDDLRPIVILQLPVSGTEGTAWLTSLEGPAWQAARWTHGVQGLMSATEEGRTTEFAVQRAGMILYSTDPVGIVLSRAIAAGREVSPVISCDRLLDAGWQEAEPEVAIPVEMLVGVPQQLVEAGGTVCAWRDGSGPALTVQLALSPEEAAGWYRRLGTEGWRPLNPVNGSPGVNPALLIRPEAVPAVHDGDRWNAVVYVDGVLTYATANNWLMGIPSIATPPER